MSDDKFFLVREVSTSKIDLQGLIEKGSFDISNNIERPGDEYQIDFGGSVEYHLPPGRTSVYPYVGTWKYVRETHLDKMVYSGCYVIICEIPNPVETLKELNLKVNLAFSDGPGKTEASVIFKNNRLFLADNESVDALNIDLREAFIESVMLKDGVGGFGEASIKDPDRLLAFANLPRVEIYSAESKPVNKIKDKISLSLACVYDHGKLTAESKFGGNMEGGQRTTEFY